MQEEKEVQKDKAPDNQGTDGNLKIGTVVHFGSCDATVVTVNPIILSTTKNVIDIPPILTLGGRGYKAKQLDLRTIELCLD